MTPSDAQFDLSVKKWDDILGYLEGGGDKTYGFLQLAESDLHAFSVDIACPYCRNQIETEVKLIGIALQFSRLANDWEYSTGVRARLGLVGKAVPLIARLTYLQITKIL